VSATHVFNYMINDPLVDWLALKQKKSNRSRASRAIPDVKVRNFKTFIMNRGLEFERKVVAYIDENVVRVVKGADRITNESCRRTIALMHEGVPVIYSAPVRNQYNSTRGIIDLLVRSDYLKRIVDVCPLSRDDQLICAPKLTGDGAFHYVVVDIKFSTLPLRADGRHILNSGNYPAYKSQLCIYNRCVGHIQGYLPRYSFVLGRRWRMRKRSGTQLNYNCFDRLGAVDFEGVDSIYTDKTKQAIKWVRDVKRYGHEWTLYPPTRVELYPNMCVDSGYWNVEKQEIAGKLNEMTSVWNVGVRHRNHALSNGITSWKNKNCTSSSMNPARAQKRHDFHDRGGVGRRRCMVLQELYV
jgi:hypothetical protein